MKVKRIIKDDILSSKKLLELAKRVNWNEDKMLDELRKQNPKVSNSDLQAIVEAFLILYKKSTKDSNERLKSYNIKNHSTGKTYRVKAKSFKDAKEKYEKYLKDRNSFEYKGYVIIKSSYGWKVKIGNKIIEFATDKEAKEYIDLHKDTFSEDANWDTLLANLGFAHNQGTGDIQIWKYRDKDRDKFEKAIEHIRRVDRKLILSASSQSSGEHKITIMKPITDSWTEDEQLKYRTTYRGEESQEIRLSEGSCYCNYDKTRNVTHVTFMGGQRNQTSRDFTIRGKITTVEQLKKEIDKHLKYLSSIDSLTEDAVIYGEWKDKDGLWNVNTNDLQETKRKLRAAGYKYISHDVNKKGLMYKYTVQYTKDSITEDATLAQLEIKNTFLEEDDDANEVKYLGFNDDRKISFYEYGDKYFAFFDLENRVEVIEKDEVQRILKKNLIKETDQDKDELFREGDEGIATTVRSENEGGSK